ncbi:MAG: alpha/beta hydrolase fold domain-containing protein [Chloroflexota bacterium]
MSANDHRSVRGRHGRGLAAASLARFAPAAQDATPPPAAEGWEVPGYRLPLPGTVSDEMRELIAAPPGAFWQSSPTAGQFRQAQEAAAEARAEPTRATWRELGLAVEETAIAGVPVYILTPPNMEERNRDRLLVNTHGGAYVFNKGVAASADAAFIAHAAGIRTVAIDYRMPPDHPFPAGLDDSVAVFTEVIKERDPGKTGFTGTSAGGNMAMATLLKLAELGRPLPAALMINSPWTDLSGAGDSNVVNEMVDNIIVTSDGAVKGAANLYAAGVSLTDPLVSPVYADLSPFPPTLLLTGTRYLNLSLTVRVHRALRQLGIDAELHVWEGLPHAMWMPWDDPVRLAQSSPPEAEDCFREIREFFDRRLG